MTERVSRTPRARLELLAACLFNALGACIALWAAMRFIESRGFPPGGPFGTSQFKLFISHFTVSLLLAPVFFRILRSFQLHASPKQSLSFSAVIGMGYLGSTGMLLGAAQFFLSAELWKQILDPLAFLGKLYCVYLISSWMGILFIGNAFPVLIPSGAIIGLIDYVIFNYYVREDE